MGTQLLKTWLGFYLFFLAVNADDATNSTQSTTSKPKLLVTAVLDKPFVIKSGDGYEGFSIDLLDKIADDAGFEYDVILTDDNLYGTLSSGVWNGMMGDVITEKCNLTIGPLTVTADRAKVVSFTHPFLPHKISMLAKISDVCVDVRPILANFLYFLDPFSWSVWLTLIIALCTTVLMLVFLNYIDPYEWRTQRSNTKLYDAERISSGFGFKESLWFVVSGLLIQGYNKRPLSTASRVMTVFWWMFCLITLLTYFAVLAKMKPFSKKSPILPPYFIQNFEDLVDQNDLDYGVIRDGSVMDMFRQSNAGVAKDVWKGIEKAGDWVYVDNLQEGIDRVRDGGYIFITESPTIDYAARRDCDLVNLDNVKTTRFYSMAVKKGNTDLQSLISKSVIKKIEAGTIQELYDKWWHSVLECSNPTNTSFTDTEISDQEQPLRLDQFAGPLVLLAIGIILSVIFYVCEAVYYQMKHKQ